MANFLTKAFDSLKALFFYSDGAREYPVQRLIGASGRGYWSPNSHIDYASKVGAFWQNSAVQACYNAVVRSWTNSPCLVQKQDAEGKEVGVPEHPLSLILRQPNEAYDGMTLWAGTLLSLLFCADGGTAYWGVNRHEQGGDIAEFVYIPHSCITPKRDKGSNNARADYYEFDDGSGRAVRVDYADIIQFRYGIDPNNPLLGLSPLASATRGIYNDNEAENVEATTLTNRGAAWMIISPADSESRFDDPVGLKEHIVAETTGDKRSGILVLDGAAKTEFPPTSEEMGKDAVRNRSEARIAALLGFSPMWIGLSVGLEHSTYSNMEDANKAAWQTLMSYQAMWASQLTQQVLRTEGNFAPEFLSLSYVVGWDYSRVAALMPNLDLEWERVGKAVDRGILTDDEARKEMGYDAKTPEQKAETQPPVTLPVKADKGQPPAEMKAAILARISLEASAREKAFKALYGDFEDVDETKLTDWTDDSDD